MSADCVSRDEIMQQLLNVLAPFYDEDAAGVVVEAIAARFDGPIFDKIVSDLTDMQQHFAGPQRSKQHEHRCGILWFPRQ